MKDLNSNIQYNEFGQIDVDFYVQRGRALRNQAIAEQASKLSQNIKDLLKPAEGIAANVKPA